MTDGKHTPGPWCIEGKADGGFLISEGVNSYGDGPERYVGVIKADRTGELREADVRLIAAAPDLLEALIEAREMLREYEAAATGEHFNSLKINAAIAKATGAE